MTRGKLAVFGFLPGLILMGIRPEPASASSANRRVAECVRDTDCYQPFVMSHRGNGFGHPENSRAAVLECIRTGVPVLEMDLRSSRDGHIFVHHDDTLNRTTSLRGKARKFTWEQLSKARLSNGESLPRFEEIYALARGKVILNLDFKENLFTKVAAWIEKNGSFDDVIFYVDRQIELREAARAKARHPRMMLMVKISSEKELEKVRKIFGGLVEIVYMDGPDKDEVESLRRKGVKVSSEVGRFFFRNALQKGLDFLESDRPLAVLKILPSRQKPEAPDQDASRQSRDHRFGPPMSGGGK